MTRANKFKIYQDEVKERHTSHWDWDYLSTEEIEALMDEQRQREAAARAAVDSAHPGLIARLRGLLRRASRRD